jgi:hypothetical protein
MTLGFLKYTLMPWLTCIEQEDHSRLPRGQFAKFNTDELLRTDITRRWEAYRLRSRHRRLQRERDSRHGRHEPIGPEGDIRLQPANFVPLGTPPGRNGRSQSDPPAAPASKKEK